MVHKSFYVMLISTLLLILSYLGYLILKPFLIPIAWAVVFSILFYPLYAFILKYMRWKSVTTFIVLVIILLVIIVPVSYLSFLLIQEIRGLISSTDAGVVAGLKEILHHPVFENVLERIMSFFNITEEEVHQTVYEGIRQMGHDTLGGVRKGIALMLIGTFGISLIDNFLRPAIIGTRTRMHYLPLFFTVLGGIKVFGLIGIILGPLVIALLLSVIEVFRSMEEDKGIVHLREGQN